MGVALEDFEPVVAKAEPLEDSDAARRAARLTNAFVEDSNKVLDASQVNQRRLADGKLPGNLILTRDGGDHVPDLQPIKERFGPSWGCFVEMPVERGIAMLLGMEPVDAPRLIEDEDYARWAALAANALEGFDALYVHIKGPDVPAHDGRAEDKRDVIETIDRAFFSEVLRQVDLSRTVLAVTADHSTSSLRMAHTDQPVPLLVSGPGVASDAVSTFGERSVRAGALGSLAGVEIVPGLIDFIRP